MAAEQINLSREQALPFWEAGGRVFAGLARVESGDSERGLAEMSESIEALAPTGAEMPRRMMMVDLTRAEGSAGRWAACLQHANETCATVERHGHLLDQAEFHRMRGEALAHLAKPGAAEALQHALRIARGHGQRAYELRAATSLARLWLRQDDRDEALELLQPVYDQFTEGFDTRDLRAAKSLLLELA